MSLMHDLQQILYSGWGQSFHFQPIKRHRSVFPPHHATSPTLRVSGHCKCAFQIALAWFPLDRVVLGDARGTLQVYDRATGELVHCLEHTTKGRVQAVDVSLLKNSLIILFTMVFLGWEYARGRVHCCCVVCSGSECSNSTLALERVPSGSSG